MPGEMRNSLLLSSSKSDQGCFVAYGCKLCLPQDQEHGIELELSQLIKEDDVTIRLRNQENEITMLKKKVQDLEHELEQVEVLQNALSSVHKQIKNLKMQVYRKQLHNQDLKRKSEEIMEDSKRIRLDAEVQTEYRFGQIPKGDLLFEMMGRKSHAQPDEQREFCFKLFFKSPAAYRDLRTGLNNSLPYPQNFSRWTSSVDSSPGTKIFN
ncbi:unnamed protein product [Orchesella dallaii]|uniref:THAP9-like helix-turn-helix domain-containing protein n=1 Tax=Orchesella dallaii TaxID=48710 RepID=A0ABP1Q7A3_9HEXA